MGSKGRIPPSHMRRPLHGPNPFGPGIRPPHGAYPPFDMLPPPQSYGAEAGCTTCGDAEACGGESEARRHPRKPEARAGGCPI
ncbi:hypothetical protein COP2_034138 [Malus domestica]